jgi:hypothetical protein
VQRQGDKDKVAVKKRRAGGGGKREDRSIWQPRNMYEKPRRVISVGGVAG